MKPADPVVIIGGGVAGLHAALTLDRLLGGRLDVPIYLIDAQTDHMVVPSIFDAITRPNARTIRIPFDDILEGTSIQFIHDEVTHIDVASKRVILSRRQVRYGDLILAPGIESLPLQPHLKSSDTLSAPFANFEEIRAQLDQKISQFRHSKTERLYLSIIGGGLGGIETAFACQSLLEECLPPTLRSRAYVTVVEQADQLAPTFDSSVSRTIQSWFKMKGMTFSLGKKQSVHDQHILASKTTKEASHAMIWSIGVRPRDLARNQKEFRLSNDGRVMVTPTLQAVGLENVWVIGAAAHVADAGTGLDVRAHGRYVAKAIVALREGKPSVPYQPSHRPHLVTIGRRNTARVFRDHVNVGLLSWWAKEWQGFSYVASLVPVWQAFGVWWHWKKGSERMTHVVARTSAR